MPTRPRLIYDDDCGFCTWAAVGLAERGEFELVGFSDLSDDDRSRLPQDWRECAHFVTETGEVYSCGAGMMEAFARSSLPGAGLERLVRRIPGYAWVRETVYGWVAGNRGAFGRLLRRLQPGR
jgi:predicted DCC family thiol-disulfide oxidoreductase YuxK